MVVYLSHCRANEIMNLISCGDSWSAGAELKPGEHPFGKLLADLLGCNTFINQSLDASSISHLIVQLKNAIEICRLHQYRLEETVAVFFLTSIDRDLIWSNFLHKGTGFAGSYDPPYEQLEEILLNPNDPLHSHWYKKYYSEELAYFRANTTILALQKICQHHGIKDFYIWGWQTHQLWSEIDTDKFYDSGHSRLVDWFTVDRLQPVQEIVKAFPEYFWPNSSHPNQHGHTVIAKEMYKWLFKKIDQYQ
jgi:hypothetical protein